MVKISICGLIKANILNLQRSCMSLEVTHARHAALLGILEAPLRKEGWTTQLVTPGAETAVHVLICTPANEDVPSLYLSYIPLDDDQNELELMQMTCDLQGTIPGDRLREVMTFLHALNVTMPLGAFCLSPMKTVYTRHIYTHELNTAPNTHDLVRMAEMITGTSAVFRPMIQSVVQGASASEMIRQIGQQEINVPPEPKKSLLDQVTSYLERKNLKYENAMNVAAIVTIRGKNGQFNLVIQVREDDQQVIAYSVNPNTTPLERLDEMAIFVTLANYGIFIGNFELDMRDGEVRYKASHALYSETLSDEVLGALIQHSVGTFDQYAPGIRGVAEGTINARDAIARIES
jgi:hypothetical protein